MAFQYGETRDSNDLIIHNGSWGIKSTVLKDILQYLIENTRSLKDDSIARPTVHSHTQAVTVATTGANIPMVGLLNIDSVQLVKGDTVLVKDQLDARKNGLYIADTLAWQRAVGMPLMAVIKRGSENSGKIFFLNSSDPIMVEDSNITYTTSVGQQILVASNDINIDDGVLTLTDTGIGIGTYKSVTVDKKGRVVAGYNPNSLSGYGISDAYNKTEVDQKDTTILNSAKDYTDSEKGSKTWAGLTGKPTLVINSGLTDIYTKTEVDGSVSSAKNEAKSYADGLISALLNGSIPALDTLLELANAMGNDPEFATTVFNLIGTKETPAGAQAKANAVQTNLTNHINSGTHTFSHIIATPNTLNGYGIIDAVKIGDNVVSADKASKLTTPRIINLTGDAFGSVSFDGTNDVNLQVVVTTTGGSRKDQNIDGGNAFSIYLESQIISGGGA